MEELNTAGQLVEILRELLEGERAEANLRGLLTSGEIEAFLHRNAIRTAIQAQIDSEQRLSIAMIAKELKCSSALVMRVWNAMCAEYPQSDSSPARFRLGIPKEDRVQEQVAEILCQAGFRIDIPNKRAKSGVVIDIQDGIRPIPISIIAGQDIFGDIQNNKKTPLDVALVGNDKIIEHEAGNGSTGIVVRKTFFENNFRMCIAIPKEFIAEAQERGWRCLQDRVIVTSYPNTLRNFLDGKGVVVRDIRVAKGGIEEKCRAWDCYAIMDVVQSGDSIGAEGLVCFGEPIYKGNISLIVPSRPSAANDDIDMNRFFERLRTVRL